MGSLVIMSRNFVLTMLGLRECLLVGQTMFKWGKIVVIIGGPSHGQLSDAEYDQDSVWILYSCLL